MCCSLLGAPESPRPRSHLPGLAEGAEAAGADWGLLVGVRALGDKGEGQACPCWQLLLEAGRCSQLG